MTVRVLLARLIRHLSSPPCPYCRERPDDCRCDPYWR